MRRPCIYPCTLFPLMAGGEGVIHKISGTCRGWVFFFHFKQAAFFLSQKFQFRSGFIRHIKNPHAGLVTSTFEVT